MNTSLQEQGKSVRMRSAVIKAPLLSAASQAVGLLQLAALLLRFGPTNATDAYLYLFGLGTLPVQILMVGLLYPMLLNDHRITRRGALRLSFLAPTLSILVMTAGVFWLHIQERLTSGIYVISFLALANAILQARIWFYAIAAEADGHPAWLAAVALPANMLATIIVALPWPTSEISVIAMYGSLVLANAGYLVLLLRKKVGADLINTLPTNRTAPKSASIWFLSKALIGYGGLTVLQSLSLVLPPSTLTLLTLPIKVVGASSSVFVNAIMPRLVNQRTKNQLAARRFLRTISPLLACVSFIVIIVTAMFFPDYLMIVVVASVWLQSATAAAVAQRLMFRFLPPSASRTTLIVVPLIVTATALASGSHNFSLITMLCAFALVDALTSVLLLARLRDWIMTVVAASMTLLLIGVASASLFGVLMR